MAPLFLGIDVGSTTVKAVVIDQANAIVASQYLRANGQPWPTLLKAVTALALEHDLSALAGFGFTGSGGEAIARQVGGYHVNELVAQTRALGEFHAEARTVIEIGGQDSKFLSVRWDQAQGQMVLADFSMNTLCAAGTGSFLDQQAERLGIAIEEEFGRLALESLNPARIAGRCTVFAKSDMIHLQQKGTPLPDILAGLCLALARNFTSVIGKGKSFPPPVVFQGGVATNGAVVRAFESVLGLAPGSIVVPRQHRVMAALGAAILAKDEAAAGRLPAFPGLACLADVMASASADSPQRPPLAVRPQSAFVAAAGMNGGSHVPVHLGIDVGSVSTNLVLIDEAGGVVARRYLSTAGRPLEAVRAGLLDIGAEVGARVEVRSVGTTGSGRHLTADFVGGDTVRNEITAQARAAVACDPEVDTVFEIGGQDSKYIRLDGGLVVDFAMNNACAAGTGSFLEEQADRLRICIREDFSRLAASSGSPACLGERCTVFMESDLVHHQQRGAELEDLTAGLAYSIAENYLNRVVSGRSVGRRVFFQGGVAWNQSVVAAFETLLRRPITVPPHHDVSGAIGAALLARDEMAEQPGRGSNFRGFDLQERWYDASVFECRACANLCEVSKVVMQGEPPLFYGARCEKFEDAGRGPRKPGQDVPDLFAERNGLLLAGYQPPGPRTEGRLRVGVPRALTFYDLFPFWRAFFATAGCDLVVSDSTHPGIVRHTQRLAVAETCFPAKLVSGHLADLLQKDVDFLFLPSVLSRDSIAPGQTHNHYCPFIPAASQLALAQLAGPGPEVPVLRFALDLMPHQVRDRDLATLCKPLGIGKRRLRAAIAAASEAQQTFTQALESRGRQVLSGLAPGQKAAVIVGRTYNTCDLGACLDLPFKLRRLGVLAIPLEYLPVDSVDISDQYRDLYWRSGQRILAAAVLVAKDPRLQAIYLTNFNCGPDSFLISYFRRLMNGKPFLELEVDDHTADAGMLTRCEAFFDGLRKPAAAAESTTTPSGLPLPADA